MNKVIDSIRVTLQELGMRTGCALTLKRVHTVPKIDKKVYEDGPSPSRCGIEEWFKTDGGCTLSSEDRESRVYRVVGGTCIVVVEDIIGKGYVLKSRKISDVFVTQDANPYFVGGLVVACGVFDRRSLRNIYSAI